MKEFKELHYDGEFRWNYYYPISCALDFHFEYAIKTKNGKPIKRKYADREIADGVAAIVGWKFIIENRYYEGERIDEFKEILDTELFDKEKRIICFCHHLDRIYDFIKHEFKITDIFAIAGKGKVSMVLDKYLELRDVEFIGTEDWRKFSDKYYDVERLFDFAKYFWKDIVTDKKAPLTLQQVISTELKNRMTKDDKKEVYDLFPKNRWAYTEAMCFLYIGGYCDKCEPDSDLVHIKGKICHIDFKTSYVARMLTEYYPMSAFERADVGGLDKALKEKCCIIKFTAKNVFSPKIRFLSNAKFISAENPMYDKSRRLIKADSVTLLLNEMDFEIFCRCYRHDSLFIEDLYVADRGQLPKYVRSVAEDYFQAKETSEGIDKAWAKACTEVVYGATVKGLYNVKDKEWDDIRKQAILSPYWGIWTSSHARYALISVILMIGDDFLYSDTDSIYFTSPIEHIHLIEEYNTNRRLKMFKYCFDNGKIYEVFKDLGTFTYKDGATQDHFTIDEFICPGPKRYAYRGECGFVTKIAGAKKQYLKDGKLVNAWEKLYTPDEFFSIYNDRRKVPDIIHCVDEGIDESCVLLYKGKVFTSKSYRLEYDVNTKISTIDMLQYAKEAEQELQKEFDRFGREKRR